MCEANYMLNVSVDKEQRMILQQIFNRKHSVNFLSKRYIDIFHVRRALSSFLGAYEKMTDSMSKVFLLSI